MLTLRNVKTQALVLTMVGAIAVSSILGPAMASADSPGRDSNPSFGRVSEDIRSSSRPLTPSSLTELETYHALIRHATHERIISRVNWPDSPTPPSSKPTRGHQEPMKTHYPNHTDNGDAAVGIIPQPSLMPTIDVERISVDVGPMRPVERVSVEPLPSPKPTLDVERISVDVGPIRPVERVSAAPFPSPKPTLDVGRISLDVGPVFSWGHMERVQLHFLGLTGDVNPVGIIDPNHRPKYGKAIIDPIYRGGSPNFAGTAGRRAQVAPIPYLPNQAIVDAIRTAQRN